MAHDDDFNKGEGILKGISRGKYEIMIRVKMEGKRGIFKDDGKLINMKGENLWKEGELVKITFA